MYHEFFGIDEQAFSIAVNPRYMYMSAQHKEALAHLLYGVKSGGFVMLTGEVGTGKTTIVRCLLDQLPETTDLAVILNPSANVRDLLCSICDELKITYDPLEKSLKVLNTALRDYLLENHRRGHNTIVLIDEAQLLRVSTLEQVRLLTNLETNTKKLLQMILVGQPELNQLLAKPELRQLSQRITARYHLRPLNLEETQAYIKHRLKIAGMPPGRQPFTENIYKRIFQFTNGIPRLINVMCDRMLLGAYSRDTTEINAEICKQAASEVSGEIPNQPFAVNKRWIEIGSTAVIVFALTLALFWLWSGITDDTPATSQVTYTQPSQQPVKRNLVLRTPAKAPGLAPWNTSKDAALRTAAKAVNINLFGGAEPCPQLKRLNWQCETQELATWNELKDIDRTGALTIITEGRIQAYATLVGLDDNHAWIQLEDEIQKIELPRLGSLWTGEFTFIWRKPSNYQASIGKGMQSALVKWVAEQFAVLDGQEKPLTENVFSTALQERVKLFQRANNLEDDGFVGMHTLLKLNTAVGKETPLSIITRRLAENSAAVSGGEGQ